MLAFATSVRGCGRLLAGAPWSLASRRHRERTCRQAFELVARQSFEQQRREMSKSSKREEEKTQTIAEPVGGDDDNNNTPPAAAPDQSLAERLKKTVQLYGVTATVFHSSV